MDVSFGRNGMRPYFMDRSAMYLGAWGFYTPARESKQV